MPTDHDRHIRRLDETVWLDLERTRNAAPQDNAALASRLSRIAGGR